MRELIVNKNEAGQRFDKLLFKYLNAAPASFVYKMLRKKNITLNNKKSDGKDKLREGDVIKIFMTDETIDKFREKKELSDIMPKFHLDVVYEDENIIIVNKPAGILSQKAVKDDISINEYIIDYLIKSKQLTHSDLQTFKPGICNRLDRNTSGLVVAGKSLLGLQTMSEMLKDRTFDKYYLTIVLGTVKEKMNIKGYLAKDSVKNKVSITSERKEGASYIETEYEPIAANNQYTVLKVKLITGKPHQIRGHLASINHPIIGDCKYGNADVNSELKKACKVKSQLLHAWKIEFHDMPDHFKNLSNKTVQAQIPEIFMKVSAYLGFKDVLK